MIAINGARGTIDKPTRGQKCESHSEIPAIWSVLTEPSIFGAEWTPMCRECYEQFITVNNLTVIGWCEECEGHHGIGLFNHPVRGMIRVCHDCDGAIDEELEYQEQLALEQEEYDRNQLEQ